MSVRSRAVAVRAPTVLATTSFLRRGDAEPQRPPRPGLKRTKSAGGNGDAAAGVGVPSARRCPRRSGEGAPGGDGDPADVAGKATREEAAKELELTPLRFWQLSQQAVAGLVAGLLHQPRFRGGGTLPGDAPAEESAGVLRRRITTLERELDGARRLIGLLKELPTPRVAIPASRTEAGDGGKRRRRGGRAAASAVDAEAGCGPSQRGWPWGLLTGIARRRSRGRWAARPVGFANSCGASVRAKRLAGAGGRASRTPSVPTCALG